jgi:hypothetical protein
VKLTIDQVAYALVGLLCVIGTALVILSRLNILSLGSKKSTPCEDCAVKISTGAQNVQGVVVTEVKHVKDDVTHIRSELNALKSTQVTIGRDISFVRGWLVKNGRGFNEQKGPMD